MTNLTDTLFWIENQKMCQKQQAMHPHYILKDDGEELTLIPLSSKNWMWETAPSLKLWIAKEKGWHTNYLAFNHGFKMKKSQLLQSKHIEKKLSKQEKQNFWSCFSKWKKHKMPKTASPKQQQWYESFQSLAKEMAAN